MWILKSFLTNTCIPHPYEQQTEHTRVSSIILNAPHNWYYHDHADWILFLHFNDFARFLHQFIHSHQSSISLLSDSRLSLNILVAHSNFRKELIFIKHFHKVIISSIKTFHKSHFPLSLSPDNSLFINCIFSLNKLWIFIIISLWSILK